MIGKTDTAFSKYGRMVGIPTRAFGFQDWWLEGLLIALATMRLQDKRASRHRTKIEHLDHVFESLAQLNSATSLDEDDLAAAKKTLQSGPISAPMHPRKLLRPLTLQEMKQLLGDPSTETPFAIAWLIENRRVEATLVDGQVKQPIRKARLGDVVVEESLGNSVKDWEYSLFSPAENFDATGRAADAERLARAKRFTREDPDPDAPAGRIQKRPHYG